MVPKTTELTLDQAGALLKKHGFTYRTVGEGETVTDQIPAPGATIPGGSEVILYLGEPKPEEAVSVPNVLGMSADAARTALTRAGLYMKATGSSGYYTATVVAGSQSIEPNTAVMAGTVVEVQFVDNHIYD